MKTLALMLVLWTLTGAPRLNVKDETAAEEYAAVKDFNTWGATHPNQLNICWRKDADSNWTARTYDITKNPPTLWEENDYPRLMLAVKQVEGDYDKFPKGHVGVYRP